MSPIPDAHNDTMMRMAAFEHVRRLGEIHDHLTAFELRPGFPYLGQRVPLANPQRGIFNAAADAVPTVDQDRVPEAGRKGLVRRPA
jgi:hypothetical protein